MFNLYRIVIAESKLLVSKTLTLKITELNVNLAYSMNIHFE